MDSIRLQLGERQLKSPPKKKRKKKRKDFEDIWQGHRFVTDRYFTINYF